MPSRRTERDPGPDGPDDQGPDDHGEPGAAERTDPRVTRTREDIPRAAWTILVDEGADAVTHSRVARSAGYSRATLYAHWPERTDLLRDTFALLARMEHHRPTGDVRADLVGEMVEFRRAMRDRGIDRALAALADLTPTSPELAGLRDRIMAEGESVVRGLLGRVTGNERDLEAATLMLSGAVLYGALLHGTPPDEEVIAATVDLVLRSLGS